MTALRGGVLLCLVLATLGDEVLGAPGLRWVAAGALLLALVLAFGRNRPMARAMLLLSVFGTGALLAADGISRADIEAGLERATFFGLFFLMLGLLREAARTSTLVRRCGAYLIAQPAGRRYLALTGGGHLFAILLNLGGLALLAEMTRRSNTPEAAGGDPRIQQVRARRMTVALLRGFSATTMWSPLSIAVVVSVSSIPGLTWSDVALPGACAAVAAMGLGYALDRVTAPRRLRLAVRLSPPSDRWTVLARLTALVAGILACAAVLSVVAALSLIVGVLTVVPLIALGWIAIQYRGRRRQRWCALTARRAKRVVTRVLPSQDAEIGLLCPAGYVGTLILALLSPETVQGWIAATGLPLSVIVVAGMWCVLLGSFIGIIPLISAVILAGTFGGLPDNSLDPGLLALAVQAAWGLSAGATPIAALTLMMARIVGVPSGTVGLRWNLGFTVLAMTGLSAVLLIGL